MDWMIRTAVVKAVRAAVSVFVYASILISGLGVFIGLFALSEWYAGSLAEYEEAVVPIGAFMIVVSVISALGWMVQIVLSTIKMGFQLKDWLADRREEQRYHRELRSRNL